MHHELRNPADARRFLAEGLWLQRVETPRAAAIGPVLDWALELAGAGEPVPPLGFVADVGHIALQASTVLGQQTAHVPGWPEGLARTYEDYVLGKLLADASIERAGDALRQYQERDRIRGMAFLLSQLRQRTGHGGVLLNPAIIKQLCNRTAEEILAEGWETLGRDGPLPLLVSLFEELIAQVRQVAALLGPEDVFELEHRTALAAFAQRVALRQVVQATAALVAALPRQKIRPLPRRHDVPTRILDEDAYPIGGFASVSNRGTIESLLHSQLAYMEQERPDLFDIKYLRDELLYYSRDENQFLRRRRTFVFAFLPDLVAARFKDVELPWQRIVLLLALPLAAMQKLIEWLSTDALLFEFMFVDDEGAPALPQEKALVEMVLREQIENGTATVQHMRRHMLAAHCKERGRRSLCHCLTLATQEQPVELEDAILTRLLLAGPKPELRSDDGDLPTAEREERLAGWTAALEALLSSWL